jgi:steroid 5-alpha reductase family enzyme
MRGDTPTARVLGAAAAAVAVAGVVLLGWSRGFGDAGTVETAVGVGVAAVAVVLAVRRYL